MAHGCEPLNAAQVHQVVMAEIADARPRLQQELSRILGRDATDEDVSVALRNAQRNLRSERSNDVLGEDELEGAVVVSAEEVADHWATFPDGTDTSDVVSTVAPPFERLFVEFQHRPNLLGLVSWGVLLSGVRTEEGWHVDAALVGEWRKGEPVGPINRWLIPLDQNGRMRVGDQEGYGSIFVRPIQIPDLPEDAAFGLANSLIRLLGPALFAVSLMHCKNVDVRSIEPPERLSRKHERKTGHPLTRYYVLDIQPMRGVLDTEGEVRTKGLKHALHICRGHFKTFTEDAPLFGKRTGTYWWAEQARGKAEYGVVEKDYRIRLDQGLGREYVEADEHSEIKPSAPEHTGLDPDFGGRGLRAHNVTQNLLAQVVREAGHEPRCPKPDEPQFDLAWEAGEVTWVAEVKSMTPRNQERQLQKAVGQVLRYRQLLEEEGRAVKAMIATEVKPTDPSWSDLCAREGIALVWGPDNLTVE